MKKLTEYIAYKGDCFTIEWYIDEKQESQPLTYYQALDQGQRIQLLKLFKRMGDAGEIKDITKFRNEGDKIYAFKPQPDRFLCFFQDGAKIIVTNGFRKKQQKLPQGEKEKAINLRKCYLARIKKGNYYD
jgi:hypothetical protein